MKKIRTWSELKRWAKSKGFGGAYVEHVMRHTVWEECIGMILDPVPAPSALWKNEIDKTHGCQSEGEAKLVMIAIVNARREWASLEKKRRSKRCS